MEHKGIIQPLMRAKTRLPANMVIFFMDLRRLRESRLLFMHRLGNKDPRIVFVKFQQQRRAIRHHRDKLFITDPCRIKQNVITQMPNGIDHLAGVVDSAVIGSQLNNRQAKRAGQLGFFWRNVANLLAQILFIKTVRINTANETKRVT